MISLQSHLLASYLSINNPVRKRQMSLPRSISRHPVWRGHQRARICLKDWGTRRAARPNKFRSPIRRSHIRLSQLCQPNQIQLLVDLPGVIHHIQISIRILLLGNHTHLSNHTRQLTQQ
jgi:hypothetical protein